jgi:hypothetical protein
MVFSTIACVCLLGVFVSASFASSGWSRIYRGGPNDALLPYSVVQSSDGGFAMAVFANVIYVDNVGFAGHFTTQYELYLMKTDASGNVQWNQTFKSSNDPNSEFYQFSPGDTDYTLVQTADGGFAIAGSDGNHRFWLLKVGSHGELLWTNSYSQTDGIYNSDSLYSMIQTSDLGFALVGSTETSAGGRDFWLVKVDSRGIEQWNQTYNSGTYPDPAGGDFPRDDEARSVVQTRDGGFAIVGQTTTYVSLSSTYDSWLVKTDSGGNEQWGKKFAGPNSPGGDYQVVQTSDGGFALAASQVKSAENTDFLIIKTDSSGEMQWRRTYGDKYYDASCSLVELSDGGYALGGTTTEVGKFGPISRDFGLFRVDSSGNLVWTKVFNAQIDPSVSDIKSEDNAYSMILARDGSYAIAGSTQSYWDGSHIDVFFVKTESLEQNIAPSPSVSPPQVPISVGDVSGQVKVLPAGQQDAWTQANDSSSLSQGSQIKTEENTGSLKLGGTTTLQMQPNTMVEVESQSGNNSTLLLHIGEFTADVKNMPSGSTLKVEMSQGVAEIKGTIFTVTETGTKSTLSVQEGTVAFTSKFDGETVNVSAGKTITATSLGFESTPETPESISPILIIAVVAVIAVVVILGIVAFLKTKKNKPQKQN